MKRAIVPPWILLCSVIVLGLATAEAEMLKYVDAQGVTHYVDSAEKIPEAYRGAAASPRNLPPVTQMDSGFSDATLQARRREHALRDARKKQDEGDQKFRETAAACATWGVELIQKPGSQVEIFGTARERFNFDRCMNENGQPTEGTR